VDLTFGIQSPIVNRRQLHVAMSICCSMENKQEMHHFNETLRWAVLFNPRPDAVW
jgi:hypothetical protein